MIEDNKFLGSGWSFPPQFQKGGDQVVMVSGEKDIEQSLYILLTTSLQERVMQSDYGCELKDYVFESINQRFITDIKNAVTDAILNHEPRIKVDTVVLDNTDPEKGLIHIKVTYTVRMTNNRFNLVYPFYINEAFN
ncbi:GPW/gp25 family protein [uncultured Aquimarina sp.]|uniref:GPW/gp25 family protein n=1 Tax=uncultured Aquimarina sp. TaxID=575652 RepID=UPI002622D70A|nr:GPW/gp25 family protein [uncultured Aquimarina sp.]